MLELTDEPREDLERRFLKRVNKTATCWFWTGAILRQRYGYGQFNLRRVNGGSWPFRAHRVAYALWVNDIAPTDVVAHRCDNPPCVNPEHLWVTDQAGNLADMRSKSRHYTKLTPDQVREIRARYDPKLRNGRSLAREFGIDYSLPGKIARRDLWADLP